MIWPKCTCGAGMHAMARFVDGYHEQCHDCGTVWFAKYGHWQRAVRGVDFGIDRGTVEVVHDAEFGTVVVEHGEG